MTKLEITIRGLECHRMRTVCVNEKGEVCPYFSYEDCHQRLTDDALELLKEREPRVLTLEEVLSQAWDYCYIEAQVRPHSEMLEKLCGTHRLYCTTSIVLERQTRGDKEYGKTWRCWTARPTDEQREATPWDEPPKEE